MGVDIFNHGLVFGFLSAVVFCLTRDQIKANSAKMKARKRPLDTFPDAAQGNLTVAKIHRQSRVGRILYLLWIIVFIVEVVIFLSMVGQRWDYFVYLC